MGELGYEERVTVARGIMRLLERWGVDPEDQRTILGLSEDIRIRHLRRFRDDTPFPDTPEISERVEHLVGIADALRTACPRDPTRGALWINTPHRRFARRTPLATMIEDGLSGITAVRSELDCTYARRPVGLGGS
ncbi:hypothetical protein BMS3Bbin12_02106 [bacterium BMS3Bbin12]|nr:hypothetical protein BMS3Abin12_00531 [bacterium BMS3Abin12]GBE48915.1 hypothetical protein BMS3Bbin12_02106 [bacterium BMS3Bbin12]GBE49819.1 hypothetical protein BMS3Bbin13_00742 [bacterium BMS3Bbin13]